MDPDLDPPRVAALHRYPVKSLQGEQASSLEIDARGCAGDRLWSVRTAAGKIGSGKNTRRFAAVPRLLELRAEERAGRVVVTLPDGSAVDIDSDEASGRLSGFVGQPVTVARETDVSHFDDGPVSLVGLASIAALSRERGEDVDPARFRANVVLDTTRPFVEDGWVGRVVAVGAAVLRVEMTSPRCVMVDAKTAELPAQPGNLTTIGRINRACLGVVATVLTPGTIRVADALTVR